MLILKGHYNFSYDHNRGLFAARGILSIASTLQNISIWFIETANNGVRYTYYPDADDCEVTSSDPQLICLPGLFCVTFSH